MTRYQLRNTAYAMKNGKRAKYPEVAETLQPLLDERGWNWAGFPETWDVVQVKGKVKVISAIRNLQEAEAVCAQKQMAAKLGAEGDFDEKETAIVESIEAQFLDDIMDWSNYRSEWKLAVDEVGTGRIVTKLIKRKPLQKVEVTPELLQQKIDEQLRQASGESDPDKARENVTPIVRKTVVVGEAD